MISSIARRDLIRSRLATLRHGSVVVPRDPGVLETFTPPPTMPRITHGGSRPGSGRKPDDENAGPRKPAAFRLHPDTVQGLKELVAAVGFKSQADAIDRLVDEAVVKLRTKLSKGAGKGTRG